MEGDSLLLYWMRYDPCVYHISVWKKAPVISTIPSEYKEMIVSIIGDMN